MAPKSKGRRARAARARSTGPRPIRARRRAQSRFVGRDPSPVLERYPPKEGAAPRAPLPLPAGGGPGLGRPPRAQLPSPSLGQETGSSPTPPGGAAAGPTPEALIRLDRPFDVDEFSSLLGETAIRVTVPPDALAEVLRRVTEFMGFGIYVYAVSVRPAPTELLKGFIVELQRVDYDPGSKAWKPFVERGAAPPSGALP